MLFLRSLAALAAAAAIAISAPSAAKAGDLGHKRVPDGWGTTRVVNHYVYYPRYHHVFHIDHWGDPYSYRYRRPAYYPHYNSGYWRPLEEMRHRHRHVYRDAHWNSSPPGYRYYRAWGYPRHPHHTHGHSKRHK